MTLLTKRSVTRTDSATDIKSINNNNTIIRNYNKLGYQPIDIPIKVFRDNIPSHLFQRSTIKSFTYVFHDILFASCLFYFALNIDSITTSLLPYISHNSTLSFFIYWSLWSLYWICQGVICTGIWVLAHECGHQAFSSSKFINNTVGYILHTFLLVPYHSWRITHSTHHKSTNHLTRDQVFVPVTRDQLLRDKPKLQIRDQSDAYHHGITSLIEESPIYSFITVICMLTFGWPMYLLYNVSGQKYPQYGWASHFFPTSPFFEQRDYYNIVLSDIGILGMINVLGYVSYYYSVTVVIKFYLIPYLIVNGFLVTITYLQHSHPDIPHYTSDSFTFIRGAVATVDRDYGILNYFFHHIADTHVAHHMFSQMPHYHAVEATKIIRDILVNTPYYKYDNTPIIKALWDTWTQCKYVEPVDSADVLWYNN